MSQVLPYLSKGGKFVLKAVAMALIAEAASKVGDIASEKL